MSWASRHRMAATFLLLFLMASPARPVDDRQLLQANAGAKAWVLLIMDSSHSMNDEFTDTYRLPAYMDDFVYPQNAGPTSYGSKIALAKSVIRDVITKSEAGSGINWAFSYYRNPNQTLGAADYSLGTAPDFKDAGTPTGGAKNAGDYLENGGLEWLYFANCVSNNAGTCTGATIDASGLPAASYPDVQEGRFLQFGHKVMHNYYLDSRPPFSGTNTNGGTWRGAFGPHGLAGVNRGTVIYRNTAAPNTELRMSVTNGNYGDTFLVVKIDVFAPPAAATPTITNTPSITVTQTPTGTSTATKTPVPATATKTSTQTPVNTATVTLTRTSSATPTVTATTTITKTPTQTATKTVTQTPTQTQTVTQTQTPSFTATVTRTSTKTNTPTVTSTATVTQTSTLTPTTTKTQTPTLTQTQTQTRTATQTATVTQTPTITPTRTATATATRTFTPTITQTVTKTATITQTQTVTQTSTKTNTPTTTKTFTPVPPTATKTNTPVPPTNTNTATVTSTSTKTNTPLPPTATRTFTAVPPTATTTKTPVPPTNTNTATVTKTFTPLPPTATSTKTPVPPTATSTKTPVPPTATRTNTKTPPPSPTVTPTGPTLTPTCIAPCGEGVVPSQSLLPVIANWFAPAVRGLLAMAPPPPPVQTPGPCLFISGAAGTKASCAPCWYDINKLCAFYDANGNGVKDAGELAPSDLPVGNAFSPLPPALRGFDDPQADGDTSYVKLFTIRVKYTRGDQYALPASDGTTHRYDTRNNGNPPWGSCMTFQNLGCNIFPDGDADGVADTLPDRHNKGMYAALYDRGPEFASRPFQQYPFDAFAGKSCPLDPAFPACDPYLAGNDCGGFAHFNQFTANDGTTYSGAAPKALIQGSLGSPYQQDEPPARDKWPVVPFGRDWAPYESGTSADYPSGTGPSSDEAIRKLLRFVSSIVTYDSSAPVGTAYQLAEASTEVVATAPQTPVAGALEDAYEYFDQSVFKTATNATPDPAIDCRNYIIVYVTDGKDECNSDPCTGGRSGQGIAKDLAQLKLPESVPGARASAHLTDNSVRDVGIPVNIVAMADPSLPFYTNLTCIADNSGGQLFLAKDRTSLETALETILDFKRNANSFVAPAVPAFAGNTASDAAMIGAVIPSHKNADQSLSSWSIWSGSLKALKLDPNSGTVPVITAAAPTVTPTPSPGGPTPGPSTPTATPVAGTGFYPDETDPNNSNASLRKPVWNAARVLGYTDPVTSLAANAASTAPSGDAGAIQVWPGRKMIFARDPLSPGDVPMVRADMLPNTGTCTGAGTGGTCFDDLMNYMGLPWSAANEKTAKFAVKFLRGGETTNGSVNGIGRDEILNQVKPTTVTMIGPTTNPKFSYYYQDDPATPGNPPQVPTDGGNSPAGYAHKLGDIFHSEALVVEPPQYFQYLSRNLTPTGTTTPQPYLDFVNLNAKRRKVVFVGSNDGFLHAFDSGVWKRDAAFPNGFDLGTGREIFAYAPRASYAGGKYPSLLEFSPQPQYFVDGSMTAADVFLDPSFAGLAGPDPTKRVWRTVLVGGLRQGGSGYYALDVTQPDHIETNSALPTYGEMLDAKDNSPHCLDGSGGSCVAGLTSNRPYPSILWEFADSTPAACSDGCSTMPGASAPELGETWSRPVVGRIRIIATSSPVTYDDRYVAIFGGGFDPSLDPADDVTVDTKGRAFYMVDVETGQILYKAAEGVQGDGTVVSFAPMPAPPAVADYDDDGYLDVAYIGDVHGNMWRINLTPDASSLRGELQSDGQLHNYQPFLLFDTCKDVDGSIFKKPPPKTGKNCVQPIFYEPGIVYLGGAVSPPALGIAFGTGDRSALTRFNPTDGNIPPAATEKNGFYYVIDGGTTIATMSRTSLVDITPPLTNPCAVTYDPVTCGSTGFVLDYQTADEKTTSTVFSTQGELSLVTFTPDSVSPCATDGNSFRYRFFYLTGQPGYPDTGANYSGYQQTLGEGYAAAGQSTAPNGDIIDTILFSGGGIRQDVTAGGVKTIEQNWKEQQ